MSGGGEGLMSEVRQAFITTKENGKATIIRSGKPD